MNKLMKLFCLFLSAALLTACSSNKKTSILDPNEPVHLTMWHYYNGTQLVAFDNMIKEFNQTTGKEVGIYVEAFSQGNVNELADKIIDSANGVPGVEKLPDIFGAYPDTAMAVKELGYTVNLRNYLTEENFAEYVESFFEEGQFDNEQTIFPIAKSTELVYVEKLQWDSFAGAVKNNSEFESVSEDDLLTWEGINKVSKVYYEYTDSLTPDTPYDGKSFFGIDSLANYTLISLYQQGIDFVTKTDDKLSFNPDPAAFKKAWDYFYIPMVKGYYGMSNRFRSDDAKTGALLAFVASSTGSTYFPDLITYEDGGQKEADLLVSVMPTFENGKKAAVQQGAGMVVTKSDKQHEYASVEFLKWFTESSRNLIYALESSYLPVKKEALEGKEMEDKITEMSTSEDYADRYTADVFRLVLKQMQTYENYYTIPYPDGLSMRRIFDDLGVAAKEARDSVLLRTAQGEDYDTVITELTDESIFQLWYQSIVDKCEEISVN